MIDDPDSDKTVVSGPPSADRLAPSMHPNALAAGTVLGEFEIVDLVGEGGFGIVYLARDRSLDRMVAIKEYMPALLASRGHDASVSVRSERQRETFDLGLRSFVNEARMLARFEHPALIKVYRFWEANGTAYMAMPFLAGRTLQAALKERAGPPGEDWIRALLAPLMEALEVLHADKMYHRDIAPDNIMLLAGDRPVLLDFGAARRVISDSTHALTVILKPGFAPIEQYADRGGMKQGPWTDVYALAAVVYFMILGRKPPPAVGRLMEDSYEPIAQSEAAGRYSAQLLQTVDRCLSIKPQDRPQSIAAMRDAINAEAPPPAVRPTSLRDEPAHVDESPAHAPAIAAAPEEEPFHMPRMEGAHRFLPPAASSRLPLVAAGVLTFVVLGSVGAYYATHRTPDASASARPAAADNTTVSATAPPPGAASAPIVTAPAAHPVMRIASLASAIDTAVAGADPRLSMTLEAPANVPLGDELKLSVHSGSDGTLYLFAWDQAMDRIHRLATEEKAGGTAIKANSSVTVAFRDAVSRAANDAPGNWRIVSMLSATPRDFSTTPFGRDGEAGIVDRATLEKQLAARGLSGMFGAAPCAAGESCPDRYAISIADVTRPPAPPAPAADRTERPKPAQAAARAAPRKKTNDSEREYIKQFDKNLDNLLQK